MLQKAIIIISICLTIFIAPAIGQIIDDEKVNFFDTTLLAEECKVDKEQLGKLFTKLEVPAEFPGGFRKWFEFANKGFDFISVLQQLSDSGTRFEDSIIVKFIVTTEGNICSVKFESGNPTLTEPTLKLLKLSPPWRPGINGGRLLNSYRTLKLDVLIDKKQNLKQINHSVSSYFRSDSQADR